MIKTRRQRQYLQAMGIEIWRLRRDLAVTPAITALSSPADPTPTSNNATVPPPLTWEALQAQVTCCQSCALHQTRQNTVLGSGPTDADWLWIGEAPGEQEDAQGLPFVGRAGRLFDDMLYALRLSRDQVYMTNMVKCRPPANRNPKVKEMNCCYTYLQHQIALLQPKLIVALGAVAARQLLAIKTNIGALRGQRFSYENIPLIATYHPAFLLRRPLEKRQSWQDLKFIYQTFNASLSESKNS